MGSYAVYGGTGAAAAYVKNNAPDPLTPSSTSTLASGPIEDPVNTVGSIFGPDFIAVVDGRLYIGDVSALDIGSIVLIILSVAATLFKAYYDYTDWRERRLARLSATKEAKESKHAPSTLGGDHTYPPPD
jgi:hypothetical protein